jgi:outer membrane protein assembly factor BamB/tRNA A-37 threonylcarbamoyl transferase component Bud32
VRIGAAFCPNCGRTLPTTQSLIAAPLEPGMLLHNNRYKIEKRLGKGGAGDVYLARDQQLFNRPVVVKRLRVQETDARDRAEAERNFEREAQALAELNNPRFPQILDFFIEPPLFYLVMEFVAGEDLDHRLEDLGGPLSEDDVRSIGLQMAELLVYLHGQNPPIVHRDIKPGNIIINNAGQITLVDFGIARAKMKVGDGKHGAKADSAAWGTPGYAPPEQIAGRAEPASDVFALGATLHQLVTGRDPRDSPGEPFPPAISLIATISPNFSALLTRMLNPDPTQRPTAPVLRNELQTLDTMARIAKTTGNLPSMMPATAPPAAPAQPVYAPPPPQPASGAGFRFPSGDVAMSLREFAVLADRNWTDARDGLYGGRVARWLRDLGDRNAAADATAIASSEPTPDVGLEAFLERVVPGLPPATLEVAPPQLVVGPLQAGARSRQTLQIRNSSRGALRARLRPSAGWITVDPGAVTCRAGETQQVAVTITAPPGGSSQGAIDVDAGSAGRGQVPVIVGGVAAAPATKSGGLGLLARVFVGLLALAIIGTWVFLLLFPAGQPPPFVSASPTPFPTATVQATPPTPGSLLPTGPSDWTQPGYDSGHTNAAPQDAGPLMNAKVNAVIQGGTDRLDVSAPLVAQGRAVYMINRVLQVYDLQSRGVAWPGGAPARGAIILPGNLALGPGRIYAGTPGRLTAFDLATGATLWTSALPDLTTSTLTLAPNAGGSQNLYLATNGTIRVFGTDGTPGWTGPDLTGLGSLRLPAVDQNRVYVSGDTRVLALAAGDGGIQWNTVLTATQLSAPVLGPNAVLVEGRGDNTNTLYALNPSSGAVGWSVAALQGELRAPAVRGSVVYVSGDHEVAAYDEATGKQIWKQDGLDVGGRGDYLLPEPPLVGPRYLYVASNIGRVWALDATTGLLAGTINLRDQDRGLELSHNPILSNGRLYVVSANQPTLYEIRP